MFILKQKYVHSTLMLNTLSVNYKKYLFSNFQNCSKDVCTLLPVISMLQMSESNAVGEANCSEEHFYDRSRKTNQASWNKQFLDLGLPSFRSSYLFLLRVLLDVVYECMRLRLDQRPLGEPSALSVRQVKYVLFFLSQLLSF